MSYPVFIAVGKKFAFVPEAKSIIVEKGVGTIVGGMFDGIKVKGVTGASISASFFARNKDYEEVTFESLLEEKK